MFSCKLLDNFKNASIKGRERNSYTTLLSGSQANRFGNDCFTVLINSMQLSQRTDLPAVHSYVLSMATLILEYIKNYANLCLSSNKVNHSKQKFSSGKCIYPGPVSSGDGKDKHKSCFVRWCWVVFWTGFTQSLGEKSHSSIEMEVWQGSLYSGMLVSTAADKWGNKPKTWLA